MAAILLIEPDRNIPGMEKSPVSAVVRAGMAPLELATLAALTPDGYDVDIWDEAIRGRITAATRFTRHYDLVGVTGYTPDYSRAVQLGQLFRQRRTFVVAGGPGVSSEPDLYREFFDVLFIGEAEYTWPAFLAEWREGRHQAEYRQVTRVDMADSPIPKWGKIANDFDRYAWTTVQTTRGCPYDCEFCDVISLFGRQPRHKSMEQILAEVRQLQALGASGVFIADDNLYGHPKFYKELLRQLAALNRTFPRPLYFFTQITLNIANDPEMLELMSAANLSSFLIGIETPNKESLAETNKPQNYKLDIEDAIRTIQSYGLMIQGSLIVGFDHDDHRIFDQQFRFIQDAYMPRVLIHILKALPGTKLWFRLHRERRVLEQRRMHEESGMGARAFTNVVPKLMTNEELLTGYRSLLVRVFDWQNFETRMSAYADNVKRFPEDMLRVRTLSARQAWRLARFFFGSRAGWRAFPRMLGDRQARDVKKRLLARVPGDSGRARFLRGLISDQVAQHQHVVNYTLPIVLDGIDNELRRLGSQGLPPLASAVFAMPDAFRKSFKAEFPRLHELVSAGLVDRTRLEHVLVEALSDFLVRWGAEFETFDDHLRTQLDEMCGRAVAKANGGFEVTAQPAATPPAALTRVQLGRLADDLLRAVEEELRRFDRAHVAETAPGWSEPRMEVTGV